MTPAPYFVLPAALIAACVAAPLAAQSAPPLTDLRITVVTSATQAERIAPGQERTARRHDGPVTIVIEEKGIGTTRLLRIDGRPIAPPSTTRPLCGPAVTAGACRPGAIITGLEVTYHLGPVAPGRTLSIQDTSANLPAQTLSAALTFG